MKPHRSCAITALAVLLISFTTCHPALAAASTDPHDGDYVPPTPEQTRPMHMNVIDGRTFTDTATHQKYRLYGIDVCAHDQTAKLGQQTWSCSAISTAWLIQATLNQWVVCTTIRNEDPQKIARCATAQFPDLAKAELQLGLAVQLPDPQDQLVPDYAKAESAAKLAFRGLWGSSFQMPWVYRKNRVPNAPAPLTAQAQPPAVPPAPSLKIPPAPAHPK